MIKSKEYVSMLPVYYADLIMMSIVNELNTLNTEQKTKVRETIVSLLEIMGEEYDNDD